MGSVISEWMEIFAGIPQGSIFVLSYSILLLTFFLCLLKNLTFATLWMIILYTNLSKPVSSTELFRA